MVRLRSIPITRIRKELKKLNVFHPNGSLRRELDPVWQEAIEKLPGMKRKTLYLEVLRNKNIQDYLRKQRDRKEKKNIWELESSNAKNFNKYKEESEIDENSFCSSDSEIDSSTSDGFFNDIKKKDQSFQDGSDISDTDFEIESCGEAVSDPNPLKCDPLRFQIKLSEETWKIMEPPENFNRLPPFMWTRIVAAHIWDSQRLPCAYRFRVSKVYKKCLTNISISTDFARNVQLT